MDESDCPTTSKEKQWEQNVTMVGEYSRIEVAANIVKPEEEFVTMPTVIPGKGCCGDKVAEEEEPVIVTPASLELPPLRNLNHLLPTMSGEHANEEHSESGRRTCSGTVLTHSESGRGRRPCAETR